MVMKSPIADFLQRLPLISVITGLLLLGVLLAGSFVGSSAEAAPRDFSALQTLIDIAGQQGAARVIVGLNLPVGSEADLNFAQIQIQHAKIMRIQERILARLDGHTLGNPERFTTIPSLALELDAQGLALLPSLEEVVSVQADHVVAASLDESVPLIGGTEARKMGFAGQGQAVAVLDSGVDKEHPFLAGKVISEACYSTTSSSQGSKSLCPNGQDSQIGADAALPCTLPGCDHGTHVAGIAVGRGEDFSGVAPEASILAIQVSSQFSGPSCTDYGISSPCVLSYNSDLLLALEHVYEFRDSMDIAAVNISLGGGNFPQICDSEAPEFTDLVNNLHAAGIAVVAASGNESNEEALNWPACVQSVVSVGATDTQDEVAYFSNASPFLDVLAPGVAIRSSVPGGEYASWDGTSMAAPHIAGAFAVLRSKSGQAATVDDLLDAIKESGVSILDTRNGMRFPRVQIDRALDALDAGATPTPTATVTRTSPPTATQTPAPMATSTSTPPPYTFADVPPDHRYYQDVEILYEEGFIKGCHEEPVRMYCVDDALGRDEISVLIERGTYGADYAPSFPEDPYFYDISLEDWFVEWVVGLWDDGYTDGCSGDPPTYCPERKNTNAEACVFFMRMKYGADYEPGDAPNVFVDVDPEAWYAPWVASAWQEGIIEPCAEEPDLAFCPDEPISRGAAAYIMARAKGLIP